MRAHLIVLFACLLLVGCTSDPTDGVRSPRQPQAAKVGAPPLLPDFCDQLLAPLFKNQYTELVGGTVTSAEYVAPQQHSGLLRGMVCRRGVDSAMPTLTVAARGYDSEQAASTYLRKLMRPSNDASVTDAVVVGRRASVVETTDALVCYVRDGARTLAVEVSLREATAQAARRDLLPLTATLLASLPSSGSE